MPCVNGRQRNNNAETNEVDENGQEKMMDTEGFLIERGYCVIHFSRLKSKKKRGLLV